MRITKKIESKVKQNYSTSNQRIGTEKIYLQSKKKVIYEYIYHNLHTKDINSVYTNGDII